MGSHVWWDIDCGSNWKIRKPAASPPTTGRRLKKWKARKWWSIQILRNRKATTWGDSGSHRHTEVAPSVAKIKFRPFIEDHGSMNQAMGKKVPMRPQRRSKQLPSSETHRPSVRCCVRRIEEPLPTVLGKLEDISCSLRACCLILGSISW